MSSNRIKELRQRRKISAAELGRRLNSGRSTIVKLERGEMGLTTDWMRRIALVLGVDPSDLLPGSKSLEVAVVGYVGAGAQVFPVDDYAPGDGMMTVQCPRGLDPEKVVAAIVRGDSMFPINEGWVIFWTRTFEGVPTDALGTLCVCQVAHDGPMLVKQLRRGYAPGRFNLISTNAAPMEDVELEWAAKVKAAIPPEIAQPADTAA